MATSKPIRLVIDPNIIGSVLIGGVTRSRYIWLLDHIDQFDICYCDQLLIEVRHFAEVPYFMRKQITPDILTAFLDTFQSYALKINITSHVKVGRDANDYYLLGLCRDSEASYLITGDPDLLAIQSYAQAKIMSLKSFVDQFE